MSFVSTRLRSHVDRLRRSGDLAGEADQPVTRARLCAIDCSRRSISESARLASTPQAVTRTPAAPRPVGCHG